MSNLKKLKKLSASGSSMAGMAAAIANTTAPKYSNPDEDKYWKPTVDKAGNGFAEVRFLPSPDEDSDVNYVQMWNHGFQGPTGQWYIENCRSTIDINEPDPVMEFNKRLWESVTDDKSPERDQVRRQKRKLQYISNVYVVKDPANPDNEGKVFLFKYGKKIFDKIVESIVPPTSEYEQVDPMNPFDLWSGGNFRIRIRKVDGYRNYDKSDFDEPNPLFDDDDKLESVLEGLHSLKAVVAPDKFKPYDELKARLYKVLGLTPDSQPERQKPTETASAKEVDVDLDMAFLANMGSADEKEIPSEKEKAAPTVSDDDDDLEYFKNLRG